MEIDVTEILKKDLSGTFGSVHTHGVNAGTETFENAKNIAASNPVLKPDEREAFMNYAIASGFGEHSLSDVEIDALFIQWVQAEIQDGSSNIFKHNRRTYFYVGC